MGDAVAGTLNAMAAVSVVLERHEEDLAPLPPSGYPTASMHQRHAEAQTAYKNVQLSEAKADYGKPPPVRSSHRTSGGTITAVRIAFRPMARPAAVPVASLYWKAHLRAFYRQFAATIAVATVLSAIVSLTLSPALAAILLKPHGHAPRNRLLAPIGLFFRGFNWLFDRLSLGYGGLTCRLVRPTTSRSSASERPSSDAASGGDMDSVNHAQPALATTTLGNLPRLPSSPLDGGWLEPAAHGVGLA